MIPAWLMALIVLAAFVSFGWLIYVGWKDCGWDSEDDSWGLVETHSSGDARYIGDGAHGYRGLGAGT